MVPVESAERGVLAEAVLPDGRVVSLIPLTFGRSRLAIGPAGGIGYDDSW